MRHQIVIVSLAVLAGCVPFFDAEPSGSIVDVEVNACGGTAELTFEGEAALPLQACGVCPGEGHLACNGLDALRCVGASEPNACGGCLPLPGEPYDDCGVCDGDPSGYYVCDGENSLECVNAAGYNACGGCTLLAGEPGQPCDANDETATWTCDSSDSVSCSSGGPNLCGGSQDLVFDGVTAPAPGMACDGECEPQGVLRCDGADDIVCNESGSRNVCDGCGPVPGEFGAPCGRCGEYTCSDTQMFCVDPEPNQCGGCGELGRIVGEPCDGGIVICNGDDDVICVAPSGESNACGGLGELPNVPGEPCGVCDSGLWVCNGTGSVICEGDRGNAAFNDCGGCGPLPAEEGDPCGECGTGDFACDPEDPNRLICENAAESDEAQNACGGCAFLWGTPGASCGECFTWQCASSNESVVCAWAGDEPGGCPDETDCSVCDQTFRECGPDGVCGDCIDGYELSDDACLPVEEECSLEVPCANGPPRPVAGTSCERLDVTSCDSDGAQLAEEAVRECRDGICVATGDFVPAVSIECVADTEELPCALDAGNEGVCGAETCRPLRVVLASDGSVNGVATTPFCPGEYALVAGGCRTDGDAFRAGGPEPFIGGARGILDEAARWTCEADSTTDNSISAYALCVHPTLFEDHYYVSDGGLIGLGLSPTCDRGLLVAGACDGDLGVHGAAPERLSDEPGESEVERDDVWQCETRSVTRNADAAASCLSAVDRLYFVRAERMASEASCGDEGILVGGGCAVPSADTLSGSFPRVNADGTLEWQCESSGGDNTGFAVATCMGFETRRE